MAIPIPIAPGEKIGLWAGAGLSVLLLVAALSGRAPLGWSEVLGFATGAAGVYLTVKSHIWNFPIGLANNLFLGILFWQSRLYNDFGLQFVFFGLGVWGWWFWARGAGSQTPELPIASAGARPIALSLAAVPVLTLLLTLISRRFGGAAPFWDALTTALSLTAQCFLGRKWIQNWWFWIAADGIYVPLYLSRGLYLTAVLYAVFLGLCLWGLRSWRAQQLAASA